MISSLQLYKRDARRAAKELFYPEEVISSINHAKSEEEISRIMANARKCVIDSDMGGQNYE